MMRFYGQPYEYFMSMSFEQFIMLSNAVTVVEAEESMIQLRVSDFPHQKKGPRSKLYSQLQKLSRVKSEETKQTKPASTEDLADELRKLLSS